MNRQQALILDLSCTPLSTTQKLINLEKTEVQIGLHLRLVIILHTLWEFRQDPISGVQFWQGVSQGSNVTEGDFAIA